MSNIEIIDKEYVEVKVNGKGYFDIPKEILNAIEELLRENKKLKQQLYSPDQVEETCPKCGEKFIINYSREVYDLKYILTEFEKWLEEKIKSTKLSLIEIITFKRCLEKLQELKEGKK